MKSFLYLPAFVAALLISATASAQLKPPAAAPAAAGKPAAQAPTPVTLATRDPANAEKEAAGQLAAAGWLVLLDRRDWGRAWETSSSVFRATVPLATWMDGIPKVRQEMGTFVERQPAQALFKTTLVGRPEGEYVTVIFTSKFDKRELEEVVTTVRDTDGKWRVTGYSPR